MSYILDALRKSDQERQRGAAPTLMIGQAVAPPPKQPAYVSYGIFAVVLLAAGIAIGWWRPWHAEPVAPAASSVVAKPVELPVQPAASRADVVQAPAQESQPRADFAPPPAVAPAAPPAAPAAVAPTRPSAKAPAVPVPPPAPVRAALPASATPPTPPTVPAPSAAPAPAQPAAPAAATAAAPARAQTPGVVKSEILVRPQEAAAKAAQEPLPAVSVPAPAGAANIVWLSELPLALQQELPPMSVSVHAYSSRPADRLVGINNRMLREGDSVAPGLKLEQVTPEGMVFSYKGYSFKRGVK